MGQIFISYRRDDRAGYVRALLSEMKHTFGDRQTFLDMESIDAGTDFAASIEQAVKSCEVLLVMIGPSWLNASGPLGRPRLHDPDDFVRLEILTAFRHNVPAIPVLVEEAIMPSEADLPECLEKLARLQAVRLTNARWDSDVARLFEALERLSEEPRLSRKYLEAATRADQGHWQDALRIFGEIAAEQPMFRDVGERVQTLRELDSEVSRRAPANARWRQTVMRWPIVSLLLFSLPPNVLAALFNFVYNERLIVAPMKLRGVPDVESLFWQSAALINGVGFPLGIVCFTYLAWPVRTALRRCRTTIEIPRNQLHSARRRCLQLGHIVALIGAGLWMAAGPFYPVMIGAMDSADFAYFILSLFFCGLIAATYPFFGVAWLSSHILYLGLVPPGSTSQEDEAGLNRLDQLQWRYLILAGALPMLAITVALVLSPMTASQTSSALLGVLGLAGIGGFVVSIWFFRLIQHDLAILRKVVRYSAEVQRK